MIDFDPSFKKNEGHHSTLMEHGMNLGACVCFFHLEQVQKQGWKIRDSFCLKASPFFLFGGGGGVAASDSRILLRA